MPRVQYTLTREGRAETEGAGDFSVEDSFITLRPDGSTPLVIPHERVVAIDAGDHDMTIAVDDGATLRVSEAGHMLGDILKRAREARAEAWEKGLLLHGVRLVDAFAAEMVSANGPVPAEVRLYEDRLSALPESGDPVGLPYALATEVSFDPETYQVSVFAEGGPLVFGKLKLRTTEFSRLLTDLIAASRERTVALLAEHLPGLSAAALTGISNLMGDGIAARREEIEALSPGIWGRLETLVVGEELQQSYGFLAGISSAPDMALGVKQKRGTGEEGPGDHAAERGGGDGDDDSGESPLVTWIFCPIPAGRGGFVAQEITSERGHATYFFRIPDQDWRAALTRLNRAMLSLNFKRRPIFEGGEEGGRHAFAVRRLPYLRELRSAFAGRAIHTTHDAWRASVESILAS